MQISSTTRWVWTIASFFAFLVFGLTDNLKGAILPAFLRDLDFSYITGSNVLLGIYIGFLLATLLAGLLADWAGKKTVLALSAGLLAVGILGFSTSSTFWPLALSMFALGLGFGGIELGANNMIIDLHAGDKGRYLNLMSVMHGLGSMAAPLYAGFLLSGGASWREVYLWVLAPVALLLIYTLLAASPRQAEQKSEQVALSTLAAIAFKGVTPWYYALIAIYVAVEIAIASWIVEYLQTQKGLDISLGTQMLSLYFGLMMVGRFVGSFFVDRVGYLRMMLAAALASFACIGLGVFGPASLFFLLPASGFFMSIIFPTITATVSDLHTEHQGAILGLLFTFAGIGAALGPWLLGATSDWFGLQAGFATALAFCGVLVAGLGWLAVKQPRR